MRLYDDLAEWWPLMSPPADYAAEAEFAALCLSEGQTADRPRLLELGSGGGHMAVHLKSRFEMTLVDLAPRMLDQSRLLNPECRHVTGDMRSLRLGESFDAVLVQDAISHLTTGEDLLAALCTARAHLRVGGVALFCPDWTTERFAPGIAQGGTDGTGRGMRYLEWTHPVAGTRYAVDLVYLLREGEAPPRVAQDRVTLGLFPRTVWHRLLGEAGFGRMVTAELSGRDVFQAFAA